MPKQSQANEPKRYLSRPEVAERIGVKPDTLNRYRLPEPDAVIGRSRGGSPRQSTHGMPTGQAGSTPER